MKKSTRSFLVMIFLCLFLLPVCALGENAADIPEGLECSIAKGEVTITYYRGKATELTIPAKIAGCPVTSIAESAFYRNVYLTSITIPDSVTSIGDSPFSTCYNLTNITVSPNNPAYSSVNGVLFNKDKTLLIQYPADKKSKSYTIPQGTQRIATLAFEGCENLTIVNIPNSVTSIGEDAFNSCYNLTSINIPDGVTYIGGGAFVYCDSLTSITIPDSVISIGDGPFGSCNNLTSITVFSSNPAYSSVNGVLFNKDKTLLIQYPADKKSKSYTIPQGTLKIGAGAFHGCGNLTSITIPNSVTYIGDNAFSSCDNLTSINIPNGVTSIGNGVFLYCKRLNSITIPNSVTSIGEIAFNNCESLTSITIPDSVTYIGEIAFYDCKSLTSITIPDSVTYIGKDIFHRCTSLKTIIVKENSYAHQWCLDNGFEDKIQFSQSPFSILTEMFNF